MKIDESKEITFANFGKQFQEKLAWIILEEPTFSSQISEVLDINFFELKYLRTLVKDIFDFKTEFKTYPSKATIETLIAQKNDEEASTKQLKEFYNRFTRTWQYWQYWQYCQF